MPTRRSALRLAVALALAAGAPGARAEPVRISVACGSVGVEFDLCRRGAEEWAAQSGNGVRVVSTPKESNEILALYQQLLAARSTELDVLRIDVVWPGLLAPHLADLGPYVPLAERAEHFPALVEADTVGGRLVALPWFADAGLLYYRKDLLEKHGRAVPATWQELTETARLVQREERAAGATRLWGFVFQGRAYEGLTCNALEWVDAFGGGTIVDADGRVTIRNARAAAALALAASWVRDVAPVGVLGYGEEEARAAFQSGRAVFMRSWPYAWALAQAADSPVRGKVGVAPLPGGGPGGKRSATLGGWQLAVSRYSRHTAAAADLARFLTRAEAQRRAALEAGLDPTRPALYRDPELLAAIPFLAALRDAFSGAVARPARATGRRYPQTSSVFWSGVHDVLAGESTPDEGLARIERNLVRVSRGGTWR